MQNDVFKFSCTIPPRGFVHRPITVQTLLRKLTPELILQNETAAKIYDGLETNDFMALLTEQAVHGTYCGLQADDRCCNVAAIEGTDELFKVSFDLEGRQRPDAVRICDAWLRCLPISDFQWLLPGTQLFHYA